MSPINVVQFEIQEFQANASITERWIRPRIDGKTLPESLAAFYDSQPESIRNTYLYNPWERQDENFRASLIDWETLRTVAQHPCTPAKHAIATTCSCGEPGCSSIEVDITVSDDTVEWKFNQEYVKQEWHREPVPIWVFERKQYEEACRALYDRLTDPSK